MTKTEVEKQVWALPEEEQIELAYSVLEKVTPLLTQEQEDELDRRIEAYRKDPSILLSEDEFFSKLKNNIAQ